MLSYVSKSIRPLEKYMSRECVVKVSRAIYSSPRRYFGAPKFRDTAWSLIECKNGCCVIRKEVKFDAIKLKGGLSCPVSNDYNEVWCMDNNYVITDISQC